MGQKTHPTGFRIGINQTHNSKWFENYSNYKNILKEDYQIRQLFEKEWTCHKTRKGPHTWRGQNKLPETFNARVLLRMFDFERCCLPKHQG